MQIFLVCNVEPGGFANRVTLPDGTSVDDLFKLAATLRQIDPDHQDIRVNYVRLPASVNKPKQCIAGWQDRSLVLQDKDRVSMITPLVTGFGPYGCYGVPDSDPRRLEKNVQYYKNLIRLLESGKLKEHHDYPLRKVRQHLADAEKSLALTV